MLASSLHLFAVLLSMEQTHVGLLCLISNRWASRPNTTNNIK